MRDDRDAVFLDEFGRKVGDTLGGDNDALTLLGAAHPGDGFLGDLASVAGDVDDLLREMVVKFILQSIAADRLGEITVEVLACVKRPVLFIGVRGEDDDGGLTAASAGLILDLPSALDAVHLRHEVVHEDDVVLDVEGLSESIVAARCRIDPDLGVS